MSTVFESNSTSWQTKKFCLTFFVFSFWPTVLSVAPLAQHVVCLSVCDVLYSGETAGPICKKFSGKVWSDHGTTWLHFASVRVNRAMPITRKRLDRFAWMHHSFCIDLLLWGSMVSHPSDSWASCCSCCWLKENAFAHWQGERLEPVACQWSAKMIRRLHPLPRLRNVTKSDANYLPVFWLL